MIRASKLTLTLIVTLAVALTGAAARAQDAAPANQQAQQDTRPRIRVVFKNGDILRGRLVSSDDESVEMEHSVIGLMQFNLDDIESWGPAQPALTEEQQKQQQQQAAVASTTQGDTGGKTAPSDKVPAIETAPPADDAEPVVEEEESKWSGSFDAGLNGTTGNSETLNGRLALSLNKEEELKKFHFTSTYTYGRNDGSVDQNRSVTRATQEWDFRDSKWFRFADAMLEYDEDQDYKTRADANIGPGYRFYDTDEFKLTGRVGIGANYEFSGENVGLQGQAIARISLSKAINERSRFSGSAQYTQVWDELDDYLFYADAFYEIDMNETGTWKLKAGVEYRFNNKPGDSDKADTYYFTTMGYSF